MIEEDVSLDHLAFHRDLSDNCLYEFSDLKAKYSSSISETVSSSPATYCIILHHLRCSGP